MSNGNKYCILTFESSNDGSILKEFSSKINKIGYLIQKYSERWELIDICICDLKHYLLERLNYAVFEYNNMLKAKSTVLSKMEYADMSFDTGVNVLKSILDNKQAIEKRIVSLFNRINSYDYEVFNEEAILIYNAIISRKGE